MFTFLLLQIFFVTYFLLFYLDKQHPILFQKLLFLGISFYSGELLSLNLPWWNKLFCGRITCKCLDFPGLKVGKMYFYSPFFYYLMAVIINQCIQYGIRLFLIQTIDWANFFSWLFCLLSKGLLDNSFVERLQIRPGFVLHNFVCGYTNNQIQKYFNFKHLIL